MFFIFRIIFGRTCYGTTVDIICVGWIVEGKCTYFGLRSIVNTEELGYSGHEAYVDWSHMRYEARFSMTSSRLG